MTTKFPSEIASEAAKKLMQDRPYIGAGITEDELSEAFQVAIARAIVEYDTANNAITYPFEDAKIN